MTTRSLNASEPASIGSLYSVGVALAKSRYRANFVIPQAKSSNGALSQWRIPQWQGAKNTCLFLTFLCAQISVCYKGYDILVSHARAESDKKSGGMLSAAYQKTSKNAEGPGEPIKLMIQIDLCTKQREDRMGSCVKEGHSRSYCVFYNLMGNNVSPI